MAELKAVNDALFGDDDSDSDSNIETKEEVLDAPSTAPHAVVVKTLTSIGGNRGVIANPYNQEDVPAGSLILAEAPMISWEDADVDLSNPNGVEKTIRELLQQRNHQVLEVCQTHLYPQLNVFLKTIAENEIQQIKSNLLGEDHLKSLQKDFPSVTELEILQLVAVLKHNGLLSGLYRNVSMLNHSCDPNCIVFKPKSSSLHMAEVWSTKEIKRGEECLISYCPSLSSLYLPQDQSIQNIRSFLRNQHAFKCLCNRCLSSSISYDEDLEGSNDDCNDSIDTKFENELIEMEREVLISKLRPPVEMADEYRRIISWVTKYIDSQRIENSSAAQVTSEASVTPTREAKAASAVAAIDQYFNVSIPLLARAAKLAVHAANIGMELLNSECSSSSLHGKIKYFGLKFLLLNLQLEKLQCTYVGHYHPDLARTYQDIAEIIDGMMASDIQYLEKHFEKIAMYINDTSIDRLGVESVKDLKKFSKDCRNRGMDIQNMYNRRKRYPSSLSMSKVVVTNLRSSGAQTNGDEDRDNNHDREEVLTRVFWG